MGTGEVVPGDGDAVGTPGVVPTGEEAPRGDRIPFTVTVFPAWIVRESV